MKGFFSKLKKNKKGYTLTELIVVVAILGVLAVIAVPMVMNSVRDSRASADATSCSAIETAVQLCLADGSLMFSDTDSDDSTPDVLTVPAGGTGNIVGLIRDKLVGKQYPVNHTGTIPAAITDARVWYLKTDTGRVSQNPPADHVLQLN